MRKLLLGSAALTLLAVPAVGLAGKTVTSGDQSLQVVASLKPAKTAKAGNVGATFSMRVVYKSLNDGAQVKENTKAITLTLPKGMKLRTDKAPTCLVSVLIASKEADCPEGSMIGVGTGTADARPTLPTPVDAEIHVFNTMDDTNPDGSPRDPAVRSISLYAKTSIGYNAALPFDVVTPTTLRLDYPPPMEGDSQLFHIEHANFTVKANGAKSIFTRPTKCPKGGWGFKMMIENFDGPSITAGHKAPCK